MADRVVDASSWLVTAKLTSFVPEKSNTPEMSRAPPTCAGDVRTPLALAPWAKSKALAKALYRSSLRRLAKLLALLTPSVSTLRISALA